MLSCISGPALDENAEMAISDTTTPTTTGVTSDESSQNTTPKQGSGSPKQPLSPKILAPLVIPSTSAAQPQRLIRESSATRLRSGSTPPDVPPKSARMKEGSPHPRPSPFTPMSASTTSLSTSTAPTSVSGTPNSAPEGRSSPKPWSAGPSPNPNTMCHNRGQSETTQRQGHAMCHRRGESEASIMDRGRPKKRSDGSPIKRTGSKRAVATSEEQKAFETLPQGHRAVDAPSLLQATEIEVLRKQAIGQASRFEVLGSKDVDALSRVTHPPLLTSVHRTNGHRNSAVSTNAANTSARLTAPFARAAATSTTESAPIYALPASLVSPTNLYSSKKKPSPNSMPR
jgi:hypothetical protein